MRGEEEKVVQETEGNIDLNLSLSLNGRFGVDRQRNHRVSGTSFHSKVLITPENKSQRGFDEDGAELKMWPFIPNGTEVKEMGMKRKKALFDANRRRSLDSQGSATGSSTISYFPNQTIGGQGFPPSIGCSKEKNKGECVKTVAKNIAPEATIPADQVKRSEETVAEIVSSKAISANKAKGRVFNNADMPYVFTTISGRKMDGFLSKYSEEEIVIICACHGWSMTPAQFIKHAGGGDVSNPARYITINYPLN